MPIYKTRLVALLTFRPKNGSLFNQSYQEYVAMVTHP